MSFIQNINSARIRGNIGSKAKSLRLMCRNKMNIPVTYVINSVVKLKYDRNPEKTESQLLKELENKLIAQKRYAVRSSGTVEDLHNFSFAGQFDSFLEITGKEQILEHIKKVWNSKKRVEKSDYFLSSIKNKPDIEMAVILQEMVDAQYSGIAFSVNPVTGRDEIVIEAVKGKSDILAQKGETPHRWTYSQRQWILYNENTKLDKSILEHLCTEIIRLKKRFKSDVDIEWAFDGVEVFLIQARPVTTNKYPTIYSNHISREFLPGLIKPLVWSVNIPLVNGAWIRLLENILGKTGLKPQDLSRSFYYRAYFNMGTMGILFNKMGMPRDSLESLMGRKDPTGKSTFKPSLKMMVYLPRMILFIFLNLNIGKQFEKKLPHFIKKYLQLKKELKTSYNSENHVMLFDELMNLSRQIAYFNIVLPILNQFFNHRLRKKLEAKGLKLEQISFTKAFPQLNDFRPDEDLEQLRTIWNNLSEKEKEETRIWIYKKEYEKKENQNFRIRFQKFIIKFGHFSESGNDFSYPPWKENPEFIIDQLEDKGQDKILSESQKKFITDSELISKKIYKSFKKAGRYLLYRETVSSEYTKIYGLFRTLFLNSGVDLLNKGKIKSLNDIYYLTLQEFNNLLLKNNEQDKLALQQKIETRKQEMLEVKNVQVPDIIYGDIPPPLKKENETIYEGTPVSTGIYEGNIVVVNGYSDFKKDVENAILVIPFSDVGWTPIMAKAGAIVSQSGGMLSHASIIARELSIPAIASVNNVCSLEDGIRAKVDGNNGILFIQ